MCLNEEKNNDIDLGNWFCQKSW